MIYLHCENRERNKTHLFQRSAACVDQHHLHLELGVKPNRIRIQTHWPLATAVQRPKYLIRTTRSHCYRQPDHGPPNRQNAKYLQATE